MFATEAQGGGRAHELVRAMAVAWKFPCDDSQVAALCGYGESLLRWNAMAMVHGQNKKDPGIGGHISTYSSLATLLEVGFNHFFREVSRG
jgi:hypothetical protein